VIRLRPYRFGSTAFAKFGLADPKMKERLADLGRSQFLW
jgi:hypothetical protein